MGASPAVFLLAASSLLWVQDEGGVSRETPGAVERCARGDFEKRKRDKPLRNPRARELIKPACIAASAQLGVKWSVVLKLEIKVVAASKDKRLDEDASAISRASGRFSDGWSATKPLNDRVEESLERDLFETRLDTLAAAIDDLQKLADGIEDAVDETLAEEFEAALEDVEDLLEVWDDLCDEWDGVVGDDDDDYDDWDQDEE